MLQNFVSSLPKEKTWFASAEQFNEYIRKTEKISAEITTDFKKMESYIQFMIYLTIPRLILILI